MADKISALDARIREYCRENQIFGMLRITVKDEIKYEGAYGYADLENEILFTDKSVFTLYSMSKPFCTIGLLKLYDKGLIKLDEHPSRYLPEASGLHPSVTVRHLLHHISGLPDFEQNEDFRARCKSGPPHLMREHLKLISDYPMYFEPGTAGKYANINIIIAALIIENVSGLPYAEYMRSEVFEPLGMKGALVDNPTLVIPDRVQGYDLVGGKPVRAPKRYDWLLGAGDIIATVDDVYAINLAIKNKLLLKEETWRAALTPTNIYPFGMGSHISLWHGKPRITHNGGHTGFRTLHIQLPEDDFDIIFLSNSGYGDARNEISEMIFEMFYDKSDAPSDKVEMDKGYI